jgi:hypothetical protein
MYTPFDPSREEGMNVEGLAFYMIGGKPGYVPVTFSDEHPEAAPRVPVALLGRWKAAAGQEALAGAVVPAPSEAAAAVRVYVSPHTTALEITILWVGGFRVRGIRVAEALAAGGSWRVAACRHYRQVMGAARPAPRAPGGKPAAHPLRRRKGWAASGVTPASPCGTRCG